MKTVDLIYFNAGGGHRAAAQALEHVMQGERWEVRLVNLTEMLDPTDLFRKYTGIAPEDLYNKRLASGFTVGMTHELKILQYLIRLSHKAMVSKMRPYWLQARPDLVVSLIPNFNSALCESLKQALPEVPYVTVMTDMADHPPHFWIEPDQPQHIICGTARAAEQARVAGCAPNRIHRASGMILRPSFYNLSPMDRKAERVKHGLDTQTPVGLVLFGGHGSAAMKRIAANAEDTPLILICGKNAALAKSLRARKTRAPRVVLEFTSDVAYWMRLADFFIGKPGPGSLSEAIQMGLPVITTRNVWTMPQERWNTEWVTKNGFGVVLGSFRNVRSAIAELSNDLPQWKSKVDQLQNQALFEIPHILASLTPLDQPPCDVETGPHSHHQRRQNSVAYPLGQSALFITK